MDSATSLIQVTTYKKKFWYLTTVTDAISEKLYVL